MRNFNGRLKLGFGRGKNDPESVTNDIPTTESQLLEVDVIAYAEDCILSGRLRLASDRLSDVLNEHVEFELINVSAQDLLGSPPIEIAEIVVQRDEVLFVQATGPRGNPARRNHTRQHPIVVRIGPYEVRGLIHALPGTHPIENIRRRRAMIALTDATIEFSIGAAHQTRQAGVVILNRECVDSIVEAHPAVLKSPHLATDTTLVSV